MSSATYEASVVLSTHASADSYFANHTKPASLDKDTKIKGQYDRACLVVFEGPVYTCLQALYHELSSLAGDLQDNAREHNSVLLLGEMAA